MANDFNEYTTVEDNKAAQAAAQAVLDEANSEAPVSKPVIPPQPDGFVRLPSGPEAEVQELTGEDEERLSKTRSSSDPMRWYNTLLEVGTVSLDGKAEPNLDDLLVGDRETLLLAIRAATYGSEIDLGKAYCMNCREEFDAVLDVSDIPTREFKGETTFDVKLRKGGRAKVRLPNGSDQTVYMRDPDLTDSERNSLLLSRVVLTVPQNGEDMPVAGFPSLVREMGLVDRRRILDEIDKRMPGPRYDEVEIVHEDCGSQIPTPLGLVSLFPGL